MIRLFHITHRASSGEEILKDLFLHVSEGEVVLVSGPVASGKSTLLRIARGLTSPDKGTVVLGGQVLHGQAAPEALSWCSADLGFVPDRNMLSSVVLVLRARGFGSKSARKTALDILESAGLKGYGSRYPAALSSGERYRLLFALAHHPEPKAVLLDDPDAVLKGQQAQTLRMGVTEMAQKGAAVLVTTGAAEAWAHTPCRHLVLSHGRLEETAL